MKQLQSYYNNHRFFQNGGNIIHNENDNSINDNIVGPSGFCCDCQCRDKQHEENQNDMLHSIQQSIINIQQMPSISGYDNGDRAKK